jgi:hypothetical protein
MSVRPKHYRRTPVVVSVPVVLAADFVLIRNRNELDYD